eukprot:jgi/Tetstr1/466851/TSEL_011308.t1
MAIELEDDDPSRRLSRNAKPRQAVRRLRVPLVGVAEPHLPVAVPHLRLPDRISAYGGKSSSLSPIKSHIFPWRCRISASPTRISA